MKVLDLQILNNLKIINANVPILLAEGADEEEHFSDILK